jgi:hypothetical protein
MGRLFQVFAYAFSILIGAFLFILTSDGHIIKICIACNSFLQNLFAVVSILTGVIGLVGTISSSKVVAGR